MIHFSILNFNLSFITLLQESLYLCHSHSFQKHLWWFSITLEVSINFSGNPGLNILIWRKWILIFQMWLGIWMWIMNLAFSCHNWTSRRKKWISHVILLYGTMRGYGNMFSGDFCYSTINSTLMIIFFISICIEQRRVLWSSIMKILLTFIILRSLIIWSLLLSKILLGVTGCFLRTPIALWIILTRGM